ncbi:MAG: hypothetical protein EBV03_00290 [Proteobacteria bacterium]|nr:hypothetical protein [Pseudomonadota bacterium]
MPTGLSVINRIPIIAVIVVGFGLGLLSGHLRWFPASIFSEAVEAYTALKDGGVVLHDESRSYNGYNFVCLRKPDEIFLFDMKGTIVHRWHVALSKVWKHPPHIADPLPDNATFCVSGHMYPNGDALVAFHGTGDTPYGYGLVKVDKDSQVIWSYAANAHHDIQVASDGRIYVVTQNLYRTPIAGLEFYRYPILADNVAVLSPDGKEQLSISLLEAFLGTPYEEMIKPQRDFDIGHANSAAVLEPQMAASFPMFSAGDILVSLRNLSALAVISPKTRKVVWAMQGDWRGQHHAIFLPNGSIMVFDNRGKPYSRVIEIDPESGGVMDEYAGIRRGMFDSYVKSMAEPLPNRNLLVVQTTRNRIYEMLPDQTLVWAYRSSANIASVQRIPAAELTPEFCAEIGCSKGVAEKEE